MMPSNNLPDNFKETEIGPIPADWEIAPLGELCTVRGGKRLPKGHSFSEKPTPFPYIRVTDFANWSVDPLNLRYLTPEDREKLERYIITADDVYISIAGTIGRVGTIPEQLNNANLTENAARIIISDKRKLDNRYLVGFLASNRGQGQIDIRMTKTSQPKLALTRIKQIPVPLPPLPEQRRIARVLSTIQRAIAAQDDLIAAAREVKRSLMQRLFTYGPGPDPAPTKETEIGEIPEHWEVVALGDLARIVMGQSPPGSSYNQTGDGIPLINGPAEFGDKFPIFVKWTRQPTKVCQMGDILFCVRGNTTGRMNIADDEYCIGRGVASIRGIDELYDTSYLFFLLERKNSEVFNIAVAGGSTFPNITKSRLRNLKVPSPSLAEQQHIADMLSVIDRKIAADEQRKAALQALFKAMLHQLMTGQVRVKEVDL